MQFMNPFYFLLSLFIAAVILFYFFRKQYKEKPVSSNMLWEQVLNEWQASPWLKKLQQNLLFWLQILALFFLMLSLIRPVWFENALKGEHIIMIVDPSASMSANIDETSRFEKARAEMLDIAGLLAGQEVTLIKAGEKPEILLNRESSADELRNEVHNLKLTYEHENIEKALNLANSLSSGKDTAIHIFSDSLTKEQVEDQLMDQYALIHNFGNDAGNISLQSFGVAQDGGQIIGVAIVENQSSEGKAIEFKVKNEDKVLFQKNITLEGNQQQTVQIPSLPKKPYYEAVVMNNDGYLADNTSTAIYSNSNPEVFTHGEVNSFAVKGFQTIGAELLQTDSENMNGLDTKGILLAEGSSLEGIPKQPLILFNTNKEKVKLQNPITAEDDLLLEYVEYENIYIESASEEVEGDWETVLRSGDIPLVQKGKIDGQPIIIVNFSLSDSDWPLQPGFPIFLYNSYQWLSQQTDFLGYFGPGEEKWLNINEGIEDWEIYNSNDENLYSLNLTKENFKAPFIPGTYQAISEDHIYYFSVLLDEREKQAETEDDFVLNELQPGDNGEVQRQNDQLWLWFALIALGLIAFEWEVYRRGHRV